MIFWRTVLCCILLFFSFQLAAQEKVVRLLYSSSDIYSNHTDSFAISKVYYTFWTDSIVVKLKNHKKVTFSPEQIWGYQSKNGIIKRFWNGEEYIGVHTDTTTLCLYSKKSGKYTKYYFSKSLDSDILPLTRKNLKNYYSLENSCFVEKIDYDLKWYQDILSFDKKIGFYKIVGYYKECIDKNK